MSILKIPEFRGKIEYSSPDKYRLAKRSGELVLQGRFQYEEIHEGGVRVGKWEWRDLPTVDLDQEE
jgi:hypothetical protein